MVKITIAGRPGAGKTTSGEYLADILGYEFTSVGELRGKRALERGMTIDEYNKLGETDPSTDEDADNYVMAYGKVHDNFVMEGRLAWHFVRNKEDVPDSVKFFLDVDTWIGAERIYNDSRPDEKKAKNVESQRQKISKRIRSDNKRYNKLYGVTCYDQKNFDHIINTSEMCQNEVVLNMLTYLIQEEYLIPNNKKR